MASRLSSNQSQTGSHLGLADLACSSAAPFGRARVLVGWHADGPSPRPEGKAAQDHRGAWEGGISAGLERKLHVCVSGKSKKKKTSAGQPQLGSCSFPAPAPVPCATRPPAAGVLPDGQ